MASSVITTGCILLGQVILLVGVLSSRLIIMVKSNHPIQVVMILIPYIM